MCRQRRMTLTASRNAQGLGREMHDPGLTTEEMEALFAPAGRVAALLEVEATLAESQAELGLIPEESARAVAEASRSLRPDPEAVLAAGWERGTPLIGLLELVGEQLSERDREHLHRDATTQDIVDTALTWRASRAIHLLIRDLIDASGQCSRLAEAHRHSWMTGRTFLQAAAPTTFGVRAAAWLHSLTRRVRDLQVVGADLAVQLGGPVGLGSGMSGRSAQVAKKMGERLGLAVSKAPWQSDREIVVALGATAAGAARTGAKIAGDLMVLAQTEVAEISMRPGGSTAMPHKKNPVDAMRSIAASRVSIGAAAALLAAPPPRLERDAGSWQVEWHLISEVFGSAAACVQAVNRALATVHVDPARMASNLDIALGEGRPDLNPIDRLVDAAIDAFAETRSRLTASIGS